LNTKKKCLPRHKPAAVDYIMFNFGEFLSISNFVLVIKSQLMEKSKTLIKNDILMQDGAKNLFLNNKLLSK
jgi:hypothetical protein